MSFTQAYNQPHDYRFCQDSVLAPKLIAQDLINTRYLERGSSGEASSRLGSSVTMRALDVCAGCGVMGLELLHALGEKAKSLAEIDFLEIQARFEPYFRENTIGYERTQSPAVETETATPNAERPSPRLNWINDNYSRLSAPEFAGRYDLIIANPPYFEKSEGTLSENEMNNRARFFLDGSFDQLLKAVRNSLKPNGRAYVLMKSGKKHGRDAFTSARIELFDCEVVRLADVRGTDLVRITAPLGTSKS